MGTWTTRKRVGRIAAAVAATALVAACGSSSSGKSATSSTPLSLRIALTTADPAYSLVFVGQLGGFFQKHNLDLTIDTSTSIIPQVELTAGQVDLASLGVQSALALSNKGQDTRVVYWLDGAGTSGFVMAKNGITSLTQCKTVEAFPPGTSVNGWANLWKNLYHADYSIQTSSSLAVEENAPLTGTADCTVNTYGQLAPIVAKGRGTIIVNPGKPKTLPAGVSQYQNLDASIFGLSADLNQHRPAVVAFVQGMQDALSYMHKTSPEKIVALLMKSTFWQTVFGQDQAVLAQALAGQLPLIGGPQEGFVSAANWSKVLAFSQVAGLSFIDPTSPKWAYNQQVDMSFWKAATGKSS